MPKPRTRFPYWDLAKELEAEEEISLPEAVQRVVESAVEDAVDGALGHVEKGFRSARSTKADLNKARELYRKHHPREKHPATSAATVADEQKETIERLWPPTGARRKQRSDGRQ